MMLAFRVLLLLLCVGGLFSSCADDTEGCLDYAAISINVAADKACEKCCQYPKLNLSFVVYDTANNATVYYKRGDTIQTSNEALVLDNLGFYLKDIQLNFEQQGFIPIQDTINVVSETSVETKDLYSILNVRLFSSSNAQVGAFKTSGLLKGIQFDVGIPSALENESPFLQTNSRISAGSDSLLVVANRLVNFGFEATNLQGSLVSLRGNLQDAKIKINLDEPYEVQKGKGASIILGIKAKDFQSFQSSDINTFIELLKKAQVLSIS